MTTRTRIPVRLPQQERIEALEGEVARLREENAQWWKANRRLRGALERLANRDNWSMVRGDWQQEGDPWNVARAALRESAPPRAQDARQSASAPEGDPR